MRERIKISDIPDKLPKILGGIVLDNDLPKEMGEKVLTSIHKILKSLYEGFIEDDFLYLPPYYVCIEFKGYDVVIVIETEDGRRLVEGELRHEQMSMRECRELMDRLATDEDLMKSIYPKLTPMDREEVVECMTQYVITKEDCHLAKMMAMLRNKLDISELTDLLK